MSNADRCKRYRERRAMASPKSSDAPTARPEALKAAVEPKISREHTYRCPTCSADVPNGTACKNHAAPVSDYSMASLMGEVQEPTRPKATYTAPGEWEQYHAFIAERTKNIVGDPFGRSSDEIARHNLQHQAWWAEQDQAVERDHRDRQARAAAKEKTRLETQFRMTTPQTGASHI